MADFVQGSAVENNVGMQHPLCLVHIAVGVVGVVRWVVGTVGWAVGAVGGAVSVM